MLKYLRKHLNPESSMNEEGGGGGVGEKKKLENGFADK